MKTQAFCALAAALLGLAGCATTGGGLGIPSDPAALNANPPAYWVGHRVYNPKYQTWGYVKRPEDTWSQSVPVILNEQETLAPDRALESRGLDNNFQYKLYGQFAGKKGYEPVLNRLFPVFVLKNFEPIGQAGELSLPQMNRRIVVERESGAASRRSGAPMSTQRRTGGSTSAGRYENIDY